MTTAEVLRKALELLGPNLERLQKWDLLLAIALAEADSTNSPVEVAK